MRLPEQEVMMDYTNWRGERAMRRIQPLDWRFGRSEWHKDDQWLLRAVDVEKGEVREFAMSGVHSWNPAVSVSERDGK